MQLCAIFSLLLAAALMLRCRARPCDGHVDSPIVRLLHVVFVVTLALMALSSIVMLALRAPMRGWMLMLHMSAAPLFALSIALLAVHWASRKSCLLRLVLLSAFVTILTAMFTMMTWFGSDWQRWLLNVHRVASMVLLVAAAAQAGRMLFAGSADAARARD